MTEVADDEQVAETARQYFSRLVDSRPVPAYLVDNAISGAVGRRRVLFPTSSKRRSPLLLSSVVAVAAAVIIAIPVGVSLALRSGGNPGSAVVPSAGDECHMLGTLTRVDLDRTTAPPGRIFSFSALTRLTSPNEVAEVAGAVCALESQTPGVYHCPAEANLPVTYTATFFSAQQTFRPVTVLAGSCPLVSGLGGVGDRLVRAASFWTLIGAALGIPNADVNTFEGISTPPPTASPSVSTATSAPLCLASQVQVAYLMGASGAAAGNTSIVLGIRNSSARPCELRGWPVLQFLASKGTRLPTREMQTTSNFSGSASLREVILQTGTAPLDTTQGIGTAPVGSTQLVGYGYISIGSNDILLPCETAASIRVLLPGMRTPIVVDLSVPGAFPTGQVVCSAGTIQVLPVHA